jgi:excisionase family DNA binding protein
MRNCSSVRDSSGEEWFTIAEAAREVRRSRDSVERWLAAGLPFQRVRGTRYIRSTDLFAWLRRILAAEPETKTRYET